MARLRYIPQLKLPSNFLLYPRGVQHEQESLSALFHDLVTRITTRHVPDSPKTRCTLLSCPCDTLYAATEGLARRATALYYMISWFPSMLVLDWFVPGTGITLEFTELAPP